MNIYLQISFLVRGAGKRTFKFDADNLDLMSLDKKSLLSFTSFVPSENIGARKVIDKICDIYREEYTIVIEGFEISLDAEQSSNTSRDLLESHWEEVK